MDRLLMLYLVNESNARYPVQGLLEAKLQKLVFLCEKQLNEKGCKAFNYRFVRLLQPTYSQELRNDLTVLVKLGYLAEPSFNNTKKMETLLEGFGHVLRRNEYITKIIDDVLASYANKPTERLTDIVSNMTWRGKKIKELRLRTPMTFPLRYKGAHMIFKIEEDELKNLLISLNPS
ncbi:MAG: hypothetical protein V1915_00635 [Candidatus Bathyarchaeota archaeon]